jgi:hypothetical protein
MRRSYEFMISNLLEMSEAGRAEIRIPGLPRIMKLRSWLTTALALFILAVSASADPQREATLMVGTMAPSGSSAPYADGGLLLAGRLSQRVPSFPALSFWAEADVQVFNENGSSLFQTKVQSNAYAGVVGAQLGSASDRALIRPRVAVGLGLYGVETRRTLLGGSSQFNDTSSANQSVDFRLRPGMKASTGVDFFFSSGWGLGVEFFWEDIFALRSADPKNNVSGSVQFQGASFCVVLPLGHK